MRSLLLAALLLGPSTFAADKYTSTYTDMNKDCASAEPEDDEHGGDAPMACKGPGGYSIVESYSAMDNFRHVERNGEAVTTNLEPEASCSHGSYGRMMEWRLRNGKPFALIYRITCFKDDIVSGTDKTPANRTGEYLVVQPLSKSAPFSTIDALHKKDANERAHQRAEEIK
jgi:hypothetical protein